MLKLLSFKQITLGFLVIIAITSIASSSYHYAKPLPENISYESKVYNVSENDIEFLFDLTYTDENNNTVYDHEIFSTVFDMIEEANDLIVLDMFLFNNDYSHLDFNMNLTNILTNKLIQQKHDNPDLKIVFITDNLNTFYGSYEPSHITKLKQNNISIVYTNMHRLRDSNPIYSGFWRVFIQPFGNSQTPWLPHPLGNINEEVTIRGLLNVLNAKANHKKLIVTKTNTSYTSLITSANPHTASSNHNNIAIKVRNAISKDILHGEKAILDFSTNKDIHLPIKQTQTNNGNIQIQYSTEIKIKQNLIEDIKNTKKGDEIYVFMFYLSDRQVIKALKDASIKGAKLTFVLDPNKDAFGREKNGIPNRQVAYEFAKETNATIYWYNTKGEQFHTKAVIIKKENQTIVHLGSSNLTKRNLHNYNLEANVKVTMPNNSTHTQKINDYIARILENENATYTLPYDSYKDESTLKYWFYRFQEFTGLSTF